MEMRVIIMVVLGLSHSFASSAMDSEIDTTKLSDKRVAFEVVSWEALPIKVQNGVGSPEKYEALKSWFKKQERFVDSGYIVLTDEKKGREFLHIAPRMSKSACSFVYIPGPDHITLWDMKNFFVPFVLAQKAHMIIPQVHCDKGSYTWGPEWVSAAQDSYTILSKMASFNAAHCYLGARKSGLISGLHLLNKDQTRFAAFMIINPLVSSDLWKSEIKLKYKKPLFGKTLPDSEKPVKPSKQIEDAGCENAVCKDIASCDKCNAIRVPIFVIMAGGSLAQFLDFKKYTKKSGVTWDYIELYPEWSFGMPTDFKRREEIGITQEDLKLICSRWSEFLKQYTLKKTVPNHVL